MPRHLASFLKSAASWCSDVLLMPTPRPKRPFTLKDTAMVLQLLYQFISRAIADREYDKAKRITKLSMEIDRNSRSKI